MRGTAVSDNDTTWGFNTEHYADVQDEYETINVDPDQTSMMNLESAAMRWGYQVTFFEVGPYRGHTYLYAVDGRDAYDFTIRWALETAGAGE